MRLVRLTGMARCAHVPWPKREHSRTRRHVAGGDPPFSLFGTITGPDYVSLHTRAWWALPIASNTTKTKINEIKMV